MGFGPAHVLGHRRSPWWHHGDLLREERASCADDGTPEREGLQGRQASEMRFNCITGLAVEIYFEKNGRLALMAGHPSEKGFKDGKRARCASIASRGWRWSATAACSCATTNHSVRCITLLHSGIFGTCQECQQQSLVRTGNLQLYAPQVFFVIPIGRILCRQKSCVIQSHLRSLRELCPLCSRGARGSIRTQRKMGLGVWAANYTFTIVGTCNGVSIRGSHRYRAGCWCL